MLFCDKYAFCSRNLFNILLISFLWGLHTISQYKYRYSKRVMVCCGILMVELLKGVT